MYKLFLTFRYLTRKKIVIFPILVVWLCVMMMIIVTSIMGGFVEHVRQANRDLLGDIIISNRNPQYGWARYEELQQYLKQQFPEMEAATPTIQAFGLISARGGTLGVQIEGIDPVGRAKVSKFGDTLYEQHIGPLNAVEDLSPALPATGSDLQSYAVKLEETARKRFEAADAAAANQYAIATGTAKPTLAGQLNLQGLWGLVVLALVEAWILRKRRTGWRWIGAGVAGVLMLGALGVIVAWPVMFPRALENTEDAASQAQLELTRADRTVRFAAELPVSRRFSTRDELAKALVPAESSFAVPHPDATQPGEEPEQGCYAGSYVLFRRDKRGNFDRDEQPEHMRVKLTVVPMSQHGSIQSISPSTETFVLVDDAYTGVYDIDSTCVYAPFKTIQLMANMRNELLKEGDPGWAPPRCSELLIKLKGNVGEEELTRIRARMEQAVAKFQEAHPDAYFDALDVKTWFEKQEKYLNAVQNEKNMMTFILGLMSLVVVVVIFLIFYMIVRDKTRDIGIIKAVGGAEEGVAGIFVTYGAFIGIVGGLLGVVSGVAFVTHTNQIHEWIYRMTGVVIWDRSVYVFDTIPDTVNPREVALYFAAAVIAGILGAAIPAIVAASQDPVKAVRYE
ncbi:MAG TPA: FtsX-like permease family protein [Phycisphaerae bacterium]|nr:FtsX-like permease family protein [Phycisphaerae bacterium]